MKIAGFIGLGLAVLASSASAQDAHQAGFLYENPILDGVLDDTAQSLPRYHFPYHFTFDNPPVEPVQVEYRLGYTPTHLYVHIQTSAEAISYHNRGYLWGDGYKLLLGLPEAGEGTSQYYEIGVSPTLDERMRPHQNRILTYNFQQVYRPFGPDSASAASVNPDGSGFELLIAWSDLPPYHPWMSDDLGFNLYFAKGFDTQAHGYFTHGHAVVRDEGIWDEELPRRQMTPLTFESPPEWQAILLGQPARRNLAISEPLPVQFAGLSEDSRSVHLSLIGSDGEVQFSHDLDIGLNPDLREFVQTLALPALAPAIYTLRLEGVNGVAEHEIGVLPDFDFPSLRESLRANARGAPEGAGTTLLFKLEQLEAGLAALYTYETGAELLEQWAVFEEEYAAFVAGEDPYAGRATPYRRAFRSAQDGSLQPYSIKLPEDYDPSHAYPLLVFLHGSGTDEQGLLDLERGNGRFIELAPFGRDKFRAYSEPQSQIDIVEAIADVAAQFSIDENAIVIAGFSMGGYGALRAYYENPDLYSGVAVFAGHPNLANEWVGGDHPNFLEREAQQVFEGEPVFIYHGLADAGLPVNLMQQTADGLLSAGADVTTRFVEGRGHTYQDEDTHEAFGVWLDQIINRAPD
ncbi:alpha/beta hydrolase-fold protein [Oceanicaulis sp.]|uniref:alpha/beta hydrolase-fold protein n=1 Tax=Oceanicaulis sp. TaxID=1924941 RepID=UPI003D29D8A2